jgi:hypothetical protein
MIISCKRFTALLFTAASLYVATTSAEPTNIAEDDAAHSGYSGSWDSNKNGGSGFGAWIMTVEGNEGDRHSGFFIASTDSNKDLNGIAKEGKAFGLFANGSGFEQAVAYRPFHKPLAVGDSFSFMMENGRFEKKFEKDESGGGAVGLVLRTGNATSATTDYNAGAMFEFGFYQGQEHYQIYDGSDTPDSGVAFTDAGLSVSVTVTGADTYDLEIQTLSDKNLTKLPGRKFKSSGDIESMAVFNRNGEKNDVYFNQLQVARDEK